MTSGVYQRTEEIKEAMFLERRKCQSCKHLRIYCNPLKLCNKTKKQIQGSISQFNSCEFWEEKDEAEE